MKSTLGAAVNLAALRQSEESIAPESPRQMKRRLMRENGITTGRQWRKYRKSEGILTPKQMRRAA